MRTYAWIITKDHIAEGIEDSDVGLQGPSTASDEAFAKVSDGEGRLFRMYDDDGILYYTGRLYDTTGEYGEAACYAPLGNYGTPNAGCTSVKYQGHPEMDCG